MPNGGEDAFDGVAGAQMIPVLGGEVVEGENRLAVFGQAGHCFLVFGAVFLGERVHRGLRGGAGRRLPDLAQIGLHCRLHGFRELVQHIRGVVDPTPLMSRAREDSVERLPEPHGPIQCPAVYCQRQCHERGRRRSLVEPSTSRHAVHAPSYAHAIWQTAAGLRK